MFTLDEVLERTIVEIFTDGGEKKIHYYAYGYDCCDGGKTPYRFVEYTFFIAPLREVLDKGAYLYEEDFGYQYKQYVEDCSEEKCLNNYLHYDNGNEPVLLDELKLSMYTPNGMYILI